MQRIGRNVPRHTHTQMNRTYVHNTAYAGIDSATPMNAHARQTCSMPKTLHSATQYIYIYNGKCAEQSAQ